MKTYYKA